MILLKKNQTKNSGKIFIGKICLHKIFSAFLILFIVHCKNYAQQPGGVSGTKLWYLADTITIQNKNSIKKDTQLVDKSKHTQYKNGSTKPARNLNFHPAIYIPSNEKNKPGPSIELKNLSNLSFRQATVIGIYYPDPKQDSQSEFWEFNSENLRTSMKNYSIDTIQNNGKGKVNVKFARPFQQPNKTIGYDHNTAMKTATYYLASKKLNHSIWGEKLSTTLTSNFKGYLPEFIVYNRVLSFEERLQVESYLAIKYGITLDTSYLDRNQKTLWNINDTTLRRFHHRVCAIGKDSLAALNQPKANSSYEEFYSSFHTDSDSIGAEAGWDYIPKTERPTLRRSLTIAYCDSTMHYLKEGSFLFWGDDGLDCLAKGYKTPNVEEYPNMNVMRRNWLIYNPGAIKNFTKITLAGKKYLQTGVKETMFNSLYRPHDYQEYRFVLVKWKDEKIKKIDTILLCSYFGREQNNETNKRTKGIFNTRAIIWDSISWNSAYNYFTFGKVPLLNFLQIGSNPDKLNPLENYPYYRDKAIRAETHFEAPLLMYDATKPVSVYFTVSEGMPALKTELFMQVSATEWEKVENTLSSSEPKSTPLRTENRSNEDESEIMPDASKVNQTLSSIRRKTSVKDQPHVDFSYSNLQLNKTYKIEVRDSIGQLTTITFKTQPEK